MTRSSQHPPDRLIRYVVIMCDVTERVSLLDPAFARLPMPRARSSSEDQIRQESRQAETQPGDGRGQMRTDHLEARKLIST
ncbi:MAG TPA: hypothetical protein VKB35_16025 [Ktedonobacteraceae bacterium]|nr:hypothetical protein [Ktedonobacteraceae bacterium]